KRYELIARDNRVSFEMDCAHRLVSDRENGHCTMEYESVIGRGQIEIVQEEEKLEALTILTDHYHEEHFEFNRAAVARTKVLKLVVEEMTGKRRAVKR
ncbi:MAG: pyridoxamine 5'-phosphate oxidase family protein, partial [Clostridia bacterium]